MLLTSKYFIIIALGLLVGSFTNTIIYRIPRNQSIILPNSFCPHCIKPIHFYDLIPIISYLNLQGKCRYCKKDISFRYFLVETLMAGIFFAVFYIWGFTCQTISGWLLSMVIVSAAFIDIDWGIIPDKITYPAMLAGLVLSFFTVGIGTALTGSAFFAGILLLTAFISRGAMGGGDIKMAIVIGLFTGLKGAVIACLVAVILGGLYGLGLIILARAERKSAIKFGPFLALGAFIGYNFSTQLSTIYFTFW